MFISLTLLIFSALSFFRHSGFWPSGGIFWCYHFYIFGTLISPRSFWCSDPDPFVCWYLITKQNWLWPFTKTSHGVGFGSKNVFCICILISDMSLLVHFSSKGRCRFSGVQWYFSFHYCLFSVYTPLEKAWKKTKNAPIETTVFPISPPFFIR